MAFSFSSSLYTYASVLAITGLIIGIIAKKKEKNIIGIIINILAIVIMVVLIGNNYYDNNMTIYDNGSYTDSNYEEDSKVKGKYSKDIFSGNSFTYKTQYDNATFTFDKDSTFEVKYTSGSTYKGTYEVYNESYITGKTIQIEQDSSISNNKQLATDISNVANKMIGNTNDLENTFLLWLKTDNNILQPFMISYNPNTNSGIAVNILGQAQGTFTKK